MATCTKSIKTVQLSDVDPSPFNPPGRTDAAKIKKLVESIKEHGQLVPGQLVQKPNGRLAIVDCHRRVAAMRSLGMTSIRAVVYEPTEGSSWQKVVEQLFVELAEPTMTFKNGHMLLAALRGGPVFNATVKASTLYIQKLFSPDEIQMLVREKVAPYTVSVARKVAEYILEKGVGRDTPLFDQTVRKVLLWLIRGKRQQAAIAYTRNKLSPKLLKNAINRDGPVPKLEVRNRAEALKDQEKIKNLEAQLAMLKGNATDAESLQPAEGATIQ